MLVFYTPSHHSLSLSADDIQLYYLQMTRYWFQFMRRMREIEDIQSYADRMATVSPSHAGADVTSSHIPSGTRNRSGSPTVLPKQLVYDDVDSGSPHSPRSTAKPHTSRSRMSLSFIIQSDLRRFIQGSLCLQMISICLKNVHTSLNIVTWKFFGRFS